MGSEGYLINEFLAARTNQRDDQWGGDYARRMRFAVEVVKAVRQRAGHDFIIIYRLSMLDLVNDGSTLAEVTELAKAIEAAERPSSTPGLAGTKRAFRPSPRRYRAELSAGSPAS